METNAFNQKWVEKTLKHGILDKDFKGLDKHKVEDILDKTHTHKNDLKLLNIHWSKPKSEKKPFFFSKKLSIDDKNTQLNFMTTVFYSPVWIDE